MSLFFLMCSERSGSNFVSKLLNGHSNICSPSTKHIINPVARNLFRYERLNKPSNWNELLCDMNELMSVRFSVWKKTFSIDDLHELASPGDIKTLLQNIFLEEAKANGKQHVFIKENQVYEFLPFLLVHFPESKYLYQVRDPRDMALSWKKNPDHRGGIVMAAKQWKKDQQQSMKNYYLLKNQNKAHFVKYEALTKNNKEEVKKIIKFLGLPFDESVFKFHEDELTKENADMQKAWSNLSLGVIKNNSQKYASELSFEEISIVEKICYFEMKHLEYPIETDFKSLDLITEQVINDFHRCEIEKLDYSPSEGVVGNMHAKAKLYQR
ncbi:sulfotransferase family protein [Thiorhodovibrio frisius]|uniref:Sulfotransferase family protein n=1 Tax=Thiorhodovibrio frisius TaxID=631362 RepID=H8Z1W4_9GAMM|nr:sulfotransferase [Thiorhodovibrio frisius]EIC22592.1 sulfotransferase family protein [Thiorhodovibrio frisius]WPL20033.1 Sulfotransferase domain protein [Thiorhodovibrio frisius]